MKEIKNHPNFSFKRHDLGFNGACDDEFHHRRTQGILFRGLSRK